MRFDVEKFIEDNNFNLWMVLSSSIYETKQCLTNWKEITHPIQMTVHVCDAFEVSAFVDIKYLYIYIYNLVD